MTEEEWWACNDPTQMFRFLSFWNASERKCRLCSVSLCQRLKPSLIEDEYVQAGFNVAEKYADGLATEEERIAAQQAASPGASCSAVLLVLALGLTISDVERVSDTVLDGGTQLKDQAERTEQCRVLRDIFGETFLPITLDPAWLTSTVLQLARGIYDDRAFERMPILADALQDAGCDNKGILNHCRGPGPHTRGCFVVDLLLGKE